MLVTAGKKRVAREEVAVVDDASQPQVRHTLDVLLKIFAPDSRGSESHEAHLALGVLRAREDADGQVGVRAIEELATAAAAAALPASSSNRSS